MIEFARLRRVLSEDHIVGILNGQEFVQVVFGDFSNEFDSGHVAIPPHDFALDRSLRAAEFDADFVRNVSHIFRDYHCLNVAKASGRNRVKCKTDLEAAGKLDAA